MVPVAHHASALELGHVLAPLVNIFEASSHSGRDDFPISAGVNPIHNRVVRGASGDAEQRLQSTHLALADFLPLSVRRRDPSHRTVVEDGDDQSIDQLSH